MATLCLLLAFAYSRLLCAMSYPYEDEYDFIEEDDYSDDDDESFDDEDESQIDDQFEDDYPTELLWLENVDGDDD